MEQCLRIENILKGSRKWFTRDKSRSGTCSSEVVKRSICRLVWEVRWMKTRSAWYPVWKRRQLGSSSVGSGYTKAGRESWWMQNTRNPRKKHYYMSDSVPWKRVAAILHAREDVQRGSSGDSMQKGGANRPEVRTLRWYQIRRDASISAEMTILWTWWAGPGLWDQHARSEETVIECRGEVFLTNDGPVENMNKELCGLVRCFQVASKTTPGSSSPEISSVRQWRVAWRNSTTCTSGDCQRARCCAKRSPIPSWTRRASKDPDAMQGMQCMWSPVRKDKAKKRGDETLDQITGYRWRIANC